MPFTTSDHITRAFRSCFPPKFPLLKPSFFYLFMKIHETTFMQVLHTMEHHDVMGT
jgi:hypothetical protein